MKNTAQSISIEALIYKVLRLVQEGDNLFEAIDNEIVIFLIDEAFIIIDPTVLQGMDGTVLTQKGMEFLRNYKAA